MTAPAPPPSFVAYYRVSTQKQGRSGLGLEAQREAVEAHAKRLGGTVIASYTEVESGRARHRPQLAAAVAHAKSAQVPLVVAKLDRLARNTAFLLTLLDGGVRVLFLDLPELGSDPITARLILTVMAAIAEFESRRIGQRIREAFARKRARGDVLGWMTTKKQVNPLSNAQTRMKGVDAARPVNLALASAYRLRSVPILEDYRRGHGSYSKTAAALNAAGHRTRRGKPWTEANLERVLSGRKTVRPAAPSRRTRKRV